MTKKCNIVLTFYLLSILLFFSACQTSESKLQSDKDTSFDERMEWWRNARFGMFIHWGLYAIPAGEWQGSTNHAEWIRTTAQIPLETYNQFVQQFNPQNFNADEWVQAAKQAGMKYIVITSKHHDGFCLWDSEYTDYDVMSTPFQRDILLELSAACVKHNIKLCFYHSIMDWHHPDYLPRREWEKDRPTTGAQYERYVQYMKNQLQELTTEYGDIGVLWFDGEWESTWTHEMGLDLYDYVRNLKPDIIINNRVDKGRQGMAGMTKSSEYAGDFGTPEQEIPEHGEHVMDWESCMTMNNHWGYNHTDDNWKSTNTLLYNLTDIVAKGGNFLLNIGPKEDGTFPVESIERLNAIGTWMNDHQEAIYETERIKIYAQGDSIRYVKKKSQNTYYVFVSGRIDSNLVLKSIEPNKNSKIRLLSLNREIQYTFHPEQGITLTDPELINEANLPIKVLRIEGKEAQVLEKPVIRVPDQPERSQYLFYDNQTFTISTPDSTALVKYSLDGSDPTRFGVIYNGPVLIRESCEVRVVAQQPGRISSPLARVQFKKSALVKDINLVNPPHENYQSLGKMSLADGELGSKQYNDGKWLGFEGMELNAIFDLGQTKEITKVSINFLQNQGSWIFLPAKLQFLTSENGEDFTLIEEIHNEVRQDAEVFIKTFTSKLQGVRAKYIKVIGTQDKLCPDWHPGTGGSCWIFADEVVIE